MTGQADIGRLVGGMWLPAGEQHLAEQIMQNRKRMRVVDGRHTYQYHKLEAALAVMAERGLSRRVAVDIGAHVGLWSVHLAQAFRYVEAFEPVPAHVELYRRNMELFGFADGQDFDLHEVALGAAAGTATLDWRPSNTGNTHIVPNADQLPASASAVEAPVVALDGFNLQQVDLIKIDVEGFELPVIEGAIDTLLRCRPLVVVEQKGNDAKFYGGGDRDRAVARLASLGAVPLRQPISGDHFMGWVG